jgi:hypothetical protein
MIMEEEKITFDSQILKYGGVELEDDYTLEFCEKIINNFHLESSDIREYKSVDKATFDLALRLSRVSNSEPLIFNDLKKKSFLGV